MAFHDKQYSVFAILAAPCADPLWHANSWREVSTCLHPFVASMRGKASLRTLQYSELGKPISFGRLGWDDRSHAKWSHQDDEDPRHFAHVEAWAPSWSQCERDLLAPDFYFAIANERSLSRPDKQLQFSQRLLVAAAEDALSSSIPQLQLALRDLSLRVAAPVFVKTSRTWGFPTSGSGFTCAIQDMLLGHLFRPGDPHSRPLDLSTFSEAWAYVK